MDPLERFVLAFMCLYLVRGEAGKEKMTFFESSGDEHDGVCQCTISTSWSELNEYKELQDTMERLDKAFGVQDSMDYPLILDQLANYTQRLQNLEDNINSQSIAVSITELYKLRQVVADLTQKVEQTKEKDSKEDVSERIYTELQSIKNFTEDAWAQNPYRQRNFYEKQLSILREHLYKDGTEIEGTAFQGDILPTDLPPSKGWCDNGHVTFGRPTTHKYIKPKNSIPTRGAWFKDPSPLASQNRSRICQAFYEHSRIQTGSYYNRRRYGTETWLKAKCYKTYIDFVQEKSGSEYEMTKTGAVLFKDALFYFDAGDDNNNHNYNQRQSASFQFLTKKNLTTTVKTSVHISSMGHRYQGSSSVDSSIEIKVDEEGLWLIYTITSDDYLAISKIDPVTLVILRTWITEQRKGEVCAAFMMCGKMYTVKTCNKNMAANEANYVYDTRSSAGYRANYHFSSLYGGVRSLVYNSRERVLFAWDESHLVTYPIIWSGTMS